MIACGGAAPRPERPSVDAEAMTEAAALAWQSLDPTEAADLAARALEGNPSTTALEIAARSNLALGRHEVAIEALATASSPHLRRLRARAQMGGGDFQGAAATLEDDDDPWAQSVRPALVALGARPAYSVQGDEAEVRLEDLPLPVVTIRVDAVETLALIGSSAGMTVLDPSVRVNAGAIDELTIGALSVGTVPHTVRSLATVRETLGVPVGAVLGLDLLMRLSARIDGPGRSLSLLATAPAIPTDAVSAPLFTPTGSFLVVDAGIEAEPVWLTVDTAGLFPLALIPGADEALSLDERTWQTTEAGGPSLTVIDTLRVGSMSVEGIPVVRGLLGEDLARAVGAPIAGSLGWTLLSQMVTRFDPVGRRLVFE